MYSHLPELPQHVDTVIVGAGLAGLTAARRLIQADQHVLVIDRSDGTGGRVRTDRVDGFQLDRGFQVLLSSYPEVERNLDLASLDMANFDAGALIWIEGEGHHLGDPFRDRSSLVETIRTPVIPLADKARLLKLRFDLNRRTVSDLLRTDESTTARRLEALGFSDRTITRFLGPLFAGIQLDPQLTTSSRMFETIFRSLSKGPTGVPARGMGAISQQLAGSIPEDDIVLNTSVHRVAPGRIETDQASITADNVIVATDGSTAAQLLDRPDPGCWPVSCVWFSADIPPTASHAIVLDGYNKGPVRNLAVMTNVAPTYAPPGRHLIAAACPGTVDVDLVTEVTAQMRQWFGAAVDSWDMLRVDRIEHGQPRQTPPLAARKPTKVVDQLWVCGDHRDTGSIQGAMFSGRRTAEAILGNRVGTSEQA